MAERITKARTGRVGASYLALIRRFPLRPIRNDCELDAAIAVIDDGWDGSTWMAIEADRARRTETQTLRCYSWNPHEVEVLAAGMKGYLGTPLPRGLEAAVAAVEGGRAERLE